MAWANVPKGRSTLPRDWASRRQKVLARDKQQCQLRLGGCLGKATDVDHKGHRDDHELDSLRAACRPCHNRRTSQQGAEARKRRRDQRFRPQERHPGMT
jgi:5-methylcytosine-specific restriction endonuclease McrA